MAINFLISQNIDGGITTSSSSSIAGINMTSGLAMGSNAISGSNYNIGGVNQLTFNDPGEGIVFAGTTNVGLFTVDDATDSILRISNASALDVNCKITDLTDPTSAQDAATKSYVDTQISGVPQGTVTSVAVTHGGNAFTASIGNVSTVNPSVDIAMAGNNAQYVRGDGNLATFPSIPQGTITGGGTSGRVTFWNGGTSITSDSGFTFDSSDESVTVGKVKLDLGTQALPAISFAGDSNSGFYSPGTNQLNLVLDGGIIFQASSGTNEFAFNITPIVKTRTTSDNTTFAASTAFVKNQGYTTNTGTVTGVSGTSPINSSGGTAPAISIDTASASATGALTSTDWNTFNSKTSNTGTVESVGLSASGDALQITGTPVTTSGTLAISFQGGVADYINGEGDLATLPIASNSQITINTGTGLSGGGSFTLNQSGTTTLNLAATNNGTVTSVATSSPITGGTITGTGTIGFNASAVTGLDNLAETGTITAGVWNSNTQLDKTSTTAGDYQGEVVYFGSGTVAKGKIYCYAGGDWVAADADSDTTSKGLLAIAINTGTVSSVGMLTRGMWTGVDLGNESDILYLSTNAGNMTAEPPSGSEIIVRIVGTLLDSSNGQMFFHPDNTFITLS